MPRKGDYHTRICAVCGKAFRCPPSSDKVCCSLECSLAHRREQHSGGVYDTSVRRMVADRDTDPRLLRGPENINSKEWVIRSPEGHIYRCCNLMDWCREHADLLDGTPRQAWDGIAKIKYTMQGKRPRRPSRSWKGWTLLDWGK